MTGSNDPGGPLGPSSPFDAEPLDPLEECLRAGLRREAQRVHPEAQAFWTQIAQRMTGRRRERMHSKQG